MNSKSVFTSKTFWFNVVTFIVVLANYFGFAGFQVDPEMNEAFTGVVAILNVVLRFITRIPVRV